MGRKLIPLLGLAIFLVLGGCLSEDNAQFEKSGTTASTVDGGSADSSVPLEPSTNSSIPSDGSASGKNNSTNPSTSTLVAPPASDPRADLAAKIAADLAAAERQFEIDSAKRRQELEAARQARVADCLLRASQSKDSMSAITEQLISSVQSVTPQPYPDSLKASWDQMRSDVVNQYNYNVRQCNLIY